MKKSAIGTTVEKKFPLSISKRGNFFIPSFSNTYIPSAYSQRTFLIPRPLQEMMLPYEKETGFVICGENDETPASYSTAQRTYQQAFTILGLKGKYNNHDWRATFGTQLKERGLSSAQVADLMGHADTRMVETTYARTRHEGVMKQRKTLEMINSEYLFGSNAAPKNLKKSRNINGF